MKIAKKTRKTPDQIMDFASRFFGKGGENLEETSRDACCISFEGGGGFVTVSVADTGDDKREVEVETREFESRAERFLESI